MIEEHAVIIAIPSNQPSNATPQATVMLERKVACGICGQKRGCGNATWGRLLGHQESGFDVENPIGAKVGDNVIVAIEERALLSSIIYMYVLPLIGMVIGAVIVNSLVVHELYVFIGAILGLVLSFQAVKRYLIVARGGASSKNMATKYMHLQDYQSRILRFDEK
jgi:sigma-E factor negative regulatory protein RseC